MALRFSVALGTVLRLIDDHGNSIADDAADMVEGHLTEVMEELFRLDALDPSIQLEMGEDSHQVTFALEADAPNPLKAVETASTQLRSAIHAAGGSTPDWPGPTAKAWAVELVTVQAVPVEVDRGALVSA